MLHAFTVTGEGNDTRVEGRTPKLSVC